jgi:hypothetical protein
MVGMAVGVDNIFYNELFIPAGSEDILLTATRINDHSFFCFITGHYITADPHHADCHLVNTHFVFPH